MKTIGAILKMYFDPEVLLGPKKFSDSGVYHSPSDLELEDIRNMIDEYPIEEEPEVFGLHGNANITF